MLFNRKWILFFITVMLMLNAALVFAGGRRDTPRETVVAVSILPQSYFVERISGSTIKPLVLVGPGQEPHTYEPTPRQMTDLSRASVWILSGTDFEINLVPKIRNLYPNLKIVDGTQGVVFRYMEEHDHGDEDGHSHAEAEHHEEEEHGHEDDEHGHEADEHGHEEHEDDEHGHEEDGHDHEVDDNGHDDHEDEGHDHDAPVGIEIDRHTWLGREPAKILARHVCEALESVIPEQAAVYRSNYTALINDIDNEFNRLISALAPLRGSSVFVYHPSFGYFFDEFGITQEAVESGGKEPSPRQITDLITKARAEQVKVIFVQTEFPADTAKAVASAVGAEVVPLDALAEDWLANIRSMGDSLIRGMQQ